MTDNRTFTPEQLAEFAARCIAYGLAVGRLYEPYETPRTVVSLHPNGVEAKMLATAEGDYAIVIASELDHAFFVGEAANTDSVYFLKDDMEMARKKDVTIYSPVA